MICTFSLIFCYVSLIRNAETFFSGGSVKKARSSDELKIIFFYFLIGVINSLKKIGKNWKTGDTRFYCFITDKFIVQT